MSARAEPTGFLYPFIESEERDTAGLLSALAASAEDKINESRALRVSCLARSADVLAQAGAAMADRFRRGGRLFTFGNGGSATDAEGTAHLFRQPPRGRALPALSLVDDRAVLTALANDVGYELVFSRQIIAHAQPGDMAVGFSTSGDSVNMLPRLRRGGPAGPPHRRPVRVRTGRHGAERRRPSLPGRAVGERPSDPRDPGRPHARAVVDRPAASAGGGADMTDTAQDTSARGREAMVFARIEAFRRRRPRLLDDVVTLAHGAGGKASAALLDAVFLPAFAADAAAAADRRRCAGAAVG